MEFTLTLTEAQIEGLLDLLDDELEKESKRLENLVSADKITKTQDGVSYDFTGLDTEKCELISELITALQCSATSKD